jgi:hypothetical protein
MDAAYSSEMMGRMSGSTRRHKAEEHNHKTPKMPQNASGKHALQISLVHNQLATSGPDTDEAFVKIPPQRHFLLHISHMI